MTARLGEVIAAFERHYGTPPRPPVHEPFEQVLHENAAYLVDDARRLETFRALKKQVGASPEAIHAASRERLIAAIAQGGMKPPLRAEKLERAAAIALGLDAPLKSLVKRPLAEARKVLRRFPGVGAPVADRMLLFAGAHPVFAVDSNGLRVLTRLGYAKEQPSYEKTYREALGAVGPELPNGIAPLVAAHQFLRRHGQELCRRAEPLCAECPLRASCPTGRARLAGRRASRT